MTRYYEILIPRLTNSGARYQNNEHGRFEDAVFRAAGGFSALPEVAGAWRNSNGKAFWECMIPYRIMCHEQTMQQLIAEAFRLFGDQEAIFCADIGHGHVYTREDVHMEAAQ